MLGIDGLSEIVWMCGCVVVLGQKEGTEDER
jgi:hypothetical protein